MEWRWAPVAPATETLKAAGFPPHLAALLARRGVDDPETARTYLAPDLGQLHEPTLLSGLSAAVERLQRARETAEKVALVGDYDVDGVSGTAILTAVLRKCGIETHPMLPHRMHDGYGFQPVHVERAQEADCQVVITVDCGTTSHAAAVAALEAGLDVIVTDHHLPGDQALPPQVIEINPRQPDSQYPFAELCGAGLAFKLAQALAEACGQPVDPRVLLRIACLGTVADMVPLRGENRVIATVGLDELARTRSPGLRALMRLAGLKPPLEAADIGFRIGPRLNAPGRLASAEAALELLLCRDAQRAEHLAVELDRTNRERQEWERRVTKEAEALFKARDPLPAILLGWSEEWHRGVVGIAAGRLARTFNRPTILLAVDGDSATGSGRSIPAVHLYDFLKRWTDEMPRFGGHAQAIGLTVQTEQLEDLRRRWEEKAVEEWGAEVTLRTYEYELAMTPRQITPQLFQELRGLEPHGAGNAQPLVRVRGPLNLLRAPRFFGNGHLSAVAVGPDGGRLAVVGWGWQERAEELAAGDFEMLGYIESDRYRGGPVLRLLDVRPAAAEEN